MTNFYLFTYKRNFRLTSYRVQEKIVCIFLREKFSNVEIELSYWNVRP